MWRREPRKAIREIEVWGSTRAKAPGRDYAWSVEVQEEVRVAGPREKVLEG